MFSYAELLTAEKTAVAQLRYRVRTENGNKRCDASYTAPGFSGRFELYIRQNGLLAERYSIGVRYVEDGFEAMLLRVNGPHGRHTNPDGTSVSESHVHRYPPEDCHIKPCPPRLDLPHAVDAQMSVATLQTGWALIQQAARLTQNAALDRAVARMAEEEIDTGQTEIEYDDDDDIG